MRVILLIIFVTQATLTHAFLTSYLSSCSLTPAHVNKQRRCCHSQQHGLCHGKTGSHSCPARATKKTSSSLLLAKRYDDDPYAEALRQKKPRKPKKKQIPPDQRPFDEFQNLKASPMFLWVQPDLKSLLSKLGVVYAGSMAISLPIAYTTFSGPNQGVECFLSANVGALAVVTVLCARLYAGWSYVGDRLGSSVVDFEKTGWYDGDIFEKPPQVIERDTTLNDFEVQPALKRVRTVFVGLCCAFLLTFASYKSVVPVDPYQQYSIDYLQQISEDTDLANEEAKQQLLRGGNKPAYCGNRYYKAYSSGLGCD